MDFIEFLKHKRVSPFLEKSVKLRKLALWIYKQINKRKGAAIIPGDVAERYDKKELQRIVRKNRRKDFFYLDGVKIDVLRPRV